ncbi:pyrroline-5-carboxylate reductase [bacterium]|nr:pyrroline-5-carboxylate reductase [bacterium]
MIQQTIGFIGAGNMAEAIIRGLLETKSCMPDQIIVTDINEIRLAHMVKTHRIRSAPDPKTMLADCTGLVLAVKPQQIENLLSEIKDEVTPAAHTVISIAAGIPTTYIEKLIGGMIKVVRVMPNTPARFLAGAAAFCLGQHATETDEILALEIFESIGIAVKIEEPLMDAVTALSGSGPAYVFKMCEMMIAAGKTMGLPAAEAELLSVQTLFGAARMLKESGQSAAELREAVTSKGGTTQAALTRLAEDGFSEIFTQALLAAKMRSRELQPKTSGD